MSIEKLGCDELGNVAGGQLVVGDVIGVEWLCMCTGAPTNKNSEGVFWDYRGISLTKEEAMNKLKKKSYKIFRWAICK